MLLVSLLGDNKLRLCQHQHNQLMGLTMLCALCHVQLLCQNIMGLISSPLRIIVAMLMLYWELGPASLVALAVLLLLMPTQARHCLKTMHWESG